MKKFWIVILVVLVVAAGCVAAFASVLNAKRVKGSGNIVTKQVTVGAYDEIDASRGVKVVVTERPQGDVLIEADDNLIEYVVVKVDDKELKIGFDKQINMNSDIHVTVTVPMTPELRSLQASSAASIVCPGPLTAAQVKLDASSAGSIETVVKSEGCAMDVSSAAQIHADVQTDECWMDASSAAKIEASVVTRKCTASAGSAARIDLSGKAVSCDVELSSAAKFNAAEFVVGEYKIEASSGSRAGVNCLATLDADVSSGAKVSYTGNCNGVRNISSGGSVVKE